MADLPSGLSSYTVGSLICGEEYDFVLSGLTGGGSHFTTLGSNKASAVPMGAPTALEVVQVSQFNLSM